VVCPCSETSFLPKSCGEAGTKSQPTKSSPLPANEMMFERHLICKTPAVRGFERVDALGQDFDLRRFVVIGGRRSSLSAFSLANVS
jgi:hypothetical protein